MADDLKTEIRAFERLLPAIRRSHGSAWAVIMDERLQGAFGSFAEAAEDALRRFPGRKFLIRHTDNIPAHFPFLVVEGGGDDAGVPLSS